MLFPCNQEKKDDRENDITVEKASHPVQNDHREDEYGIDSTCPNAGDPGVVTQQCMIREDEEYVVHSEPGNTGYHNGGREEVIMEDITNEEETITQNCVPGGFTDLLLNDVSVKGITTQEEPVDKDFDDELFIPDEVFEVLVGDITAGAPYGGLDDGEDEPNINVSFRDFTGSDEDERVNDEANEENIPDQQDDFFMYGNNSGLDPNDDDFSKDDHVNVGLHSRPCSDDEEDDTREVYPQFHAPDGIEQPVFEVSMKFANRAEFRNAVKTAKILSGRPLKVTHNDNRRLRAKCESPECPWSLHAKRVSTPENPDFVLTTINLEHGLMCEESFEKTKIPAKWLAERFVERFRNNTTMPLKKIRHEVDATFKCEITKGKAYAARRLAVERIQGSAILQYAQLWNYVEELKRTHPGSTFEINFEPFREDGHNNKFMRFYCCFAALKDGFIRSCRPIIFVDGCFLTGLYKGQLLTAIGVDGNNGYWPIAWAVVEKECRATWVWFLTLLVADLDISRESCYFTFMSDQQKGLGSAIASVLPRAERRFCVQHLYSNFKKSHPGSELKQLLWRIASSTTEELFKLNLEALKVFDIKAYKWVLKSPARKTWVRAFFPTHVKCDTLVNNMCESFNSKILSAREKPIISMLEDIRKYVMGRIKNRGELSSKKGGSFCAAIMNIIQERSEHARGWNAISNGAGAYEVENPTKGQFVVDLVNKTCSCRLWQLSGIPCSHSFPCIRKKGHNPLSYVDSCYSKQTFDQLYRHVLMPINGHQMWPKSAMFELEPPRFVPQTGRPKKTRFEGVEILMSENGTQRLRRRNRNQCSKCGGTGHNRLTCKAEVDENGICTTYDSMAGFAPTFQDDEEMDDTANKDNHDWNDQTANQEKHIHVEPVATEPVTTETVTTHPVPSENQDQSTRKKKRGRPTGSKNRATAVSPALNNSVTNPSAVAATDGASTSRPQTRIRRPLSTSDKIAVNMNAEYLGQPPPYRVGRWVQPKRRARV